VLFVANHRLKKLPSYFAKLLNKMNMTIVVILGEYAAAQHASAMNEM